MQQIDGERVRKAIEEAERQTSGEIRVSVAPFFWGNVRRAAERAFVRLGMTRTGERNAILFFVVPARRRLVLLGDAGIHEKVGQEFWEAAVAAVTARFRDGDFTEGLVRGIEEVGRRLAEHFPYDPAHDTNELPDDVEFGKGNAR
jgi:uncharacterized membrane protein